MRTLARCHFPRSIPFPHCAVRLAHARHRRAERPHLELEDARAGFGELIDQHITDKVVEGLHLPDGRLMA